MGRRTLLYIKDNQWVRFWDTLDSIASMECTQQKDKASQFEIITLRLFTVALATGDRESGDSAIQSMRIKFNQFADFIPVWKQQLLHYYAAQYHFATGNYSKAKKSLIPIVVWEGADKRVNTFEYSQLLGLILEYELGDSKSLKRKVSSLQKYYKANPTHLEFPSFVISLLKGLSRLEKEEREEFIQLRLETIENLQGDPVQSLPIAYLDITGWLESKIANSSGIEIFRARWLKKMMDKSILSLPSALKAKLFSA